MTFWQFWQFSDRSVAITISILLLIESDALYHQSINYSKWWYLFSINQIQRLPTWLHHNRYEKSISRNGNFYFSISICVGTGIWFSVFILFFKEKQEVNPVLSFYFESGMIYSGSGFSYDFLKSSRIQENATDPSRSRTDSNYFEHVCEKN